MTYRPFNTIYGQYSEDSIVADKEDEATAKLVKKYPETFKDYILKQETTCDVYWLAKKAEVFLKNH